jgi:hypothetical protein
MKRDRKCIFCSFMLFASGEVSVLIPNFPSKLAISPFSFPVNEHLFLDSTAQDCFCSKLAIIPSCFLVNRHLFLESTPKDWEIVIIANA